MNKRVKKKIDLVLEKHDSEWKEDLLFLINRTNKEAREWIEGKRGTRHYGLCSIIDDVSDGFPTFDTSIVRKLKEIILCKGCSWSVDTSGDEIEFENKGMGNGVFVWKPGAVNVRNRFLKEIYNYIKNK